MIEVELLEYLEKNLNYPIAFEYEGLKECIILQKTGTSYQNGIKISTFAIQSYSTSLLNAAKLNEEVKDVMNLFTEHSNIVKSKLNTDYEYTDTKTKKYRYQCVYDITHY